MNDPRGTSSVKSRSTVLVQLDQKSWKKYRTFQKYSIECP